MKRADTRRKKAGEGSKAGIAAWSIAAALIVALTVFGVMLKVEQSVLSAYEKGEIFMASCAIPKGELITPENYERYFVKKELDRICIPETALSNAEEITGLIAAADIEEGTLLTRGMFRPLEEILEQLEEPVIAGLKADDLYQVAGGVLRAGDTIHIYAVDEQGQTRLIWPDVFVQQVFDSSGASIGNADRTTAASRINVYLERRNVEEFYRQLHDGSLRAVKVCD